MEASDLMPEFSSPLRLATVPVGSDPEAVLVGPLVVVPVSDSVSVEVLLDVVVALPVAVDRVVSVADAEEVAVV